MVLIEHGKIFPHFLFMNDHVLCSFLISKVIPENVPKNRGVYKWTLETNA